MEQIKETLKIVMRDLCGEKKLIAPGACEECLKKTLTKKELEHIRINYFKKGILSLYVDSSSWLYALNLKKEEILTKLQQENSAITKIVLRLGDF
ncbi:MAG: DciA family protein [Candidatus Omnitrophota bacterium]